MDDTNVPHSPRSASRFVHCAMFILPLLAPFAAMSFPSPTSSLFSSEAADTPADTRTYTVSNYRKTIAITGWNAGSPVKVMDAPMRVEATITPAKIVYSDSKTHETLGVSTFIGMTLFGTVQCRQYQTDNGYVDLVDEFASILRVKQLDAGPKFGKIGAFYECQEIKKEDNSAGVGFQMGQRKRKLWEDANPASMFPANPKSSSGPTSDAGGSMFPTGGQQPGQTPNPAQKQLMLADIEMQISQQESMLQRLRFDLLERRIKSSKRNRHRQWLGHGQCARHPNQGRNQPDRVATHVPTPEALGTDVATLKESHP